METNSSLNEQIQRLWDFSLITLSDLHSNKRKRNGDACSDKNKPMKYRRNHTDTPTRRNLLA